MKTAPNRSPISPMPGTAAGFLAFIIALTLALAASPARAQLVIVPSYDGTITSDPNAAVIESSIQTAINNVESYLANPITVDITFSEMSSGLGENNTNYFVTSYASYVTALQTYHTVTLDNTAALASLGSGTAKNPVNGDPNIIATAALLEALQVNVQGDGPLTGPVTGNSIQLNTSIMNLSRTGPQNPADYDLQAVATHEIDEVLGIGGAGSNLYQGGPTSGPVGPLDLYRYSAPGVRSYSVSTTLPDPYFSINGGTTNLVYFNQQGAADGSDMGDWGSGGTSSQQSNSPPQVQDAYGTPGAQPNLGRNEIIALDVAGWNLTAQGLGLEAIPEPGSGCLLLAGVAAIGGARRRPFSGPKGCL